MRAGGGLGIEEKALDGDNAPTPKHADQKCRKKAGRAPPPHRASRKEADIRRDKSDPANFPEVALAQCPLDRQCLVPQVPKWRGAVIGHLGHSPLCGNGMTQNMPKRPHDIGTITTRKTMDQDRIPALPDRKAGGPVLMGGTTHHGVPPRPDTAKALDDGKSFGRGLVAHDHLPMCADLCQSDLFVSGNRIRDKIRTLCHKWQITSDGAGQEPCHDYSG